MNPLFQCKVRIAAHIYCVYIEINKIAFTTFSCDIRFNGDATDLWQLCPQHDILTTAPLEGAMSKKEKYTTQTIR